MDDDEKSLFDLDIAVSTKFAATEDWDRLACFGNEIARDIFLAIGADHLKGPEFFEDCFKLQKIIEQETCECCGQPAPKIEGTWDLLRILRRASDPALQNPWAVPFGWYPRPGENAARRLRRELRLRELLECIQGRKHIKFHIKPDPRKAGSVEHNFEFAI